MRLLIDERKIPQGLNIILYDKREEEIIQCTIHLNSPFFNPHLLLEPPFLIVLVFILFF